MVRVIAIAITFHFCFARELFKLTQEKFYNLKNHACSSVHLQLVGLIKPLSDISDIP